MKQTIAEAAYESWKADPYNVELFGSSGESGYCAGFYEGAHSLASKEFHTQGMYSEEEAKILAWGAWYESGFCPNSSEENFDKWFEINKKKEEEE